MEQKEPDRKSTTGSGGFARVQIGQELTEALASLLTQSLGTARCRPFSDYYNCMSRYTVPTAILVDKCYSNPTASSNNPVSHQ